MVVHNPTSFHAIAQVTVKNTRQTSFFAALDGTPLSLLTILHQTLGKEERGYWSNYKHGFGSVKCFWNSFPEALPYEMAGKYSAASGTDNL